MPRGDSCVGKVLPDQSNPSRRGQDGFPVFGVKIEPLNESHSAVSLENVPAGEAPFLVEMVEDRSVDGGKFLQTSHAAKALHLPLSELPPEIRTVT